jgi:hypothetical protein
MKDTLRQLTINVSQLNRQHVQLIVLVVTLMLFVLGAGAPVSGGGPGINSGPSF